MKRAADTHIKLTPAEAETMQKSVDLIAKALNDALAEARKMAGAEGEPLDMATALALTMVVVRQGNVTPQIPISVTCSLMGALIERGYGEYLGMVKNDEEPVTLQ